MKGNVTNTGYWPNSPDRNNDYNIIPSNEITMEGMNMPLIGISNTGDIRVMRPNENHKFNGNYVTEFPMNNNAIFLGKYKFANGGLVKLDEGGPGPKLSAKQMKFILDPYNQDRIGRAAYDEASDKLAKTSLEAEQEKERVAKVRKNIIPAAKKLDAADSQLYLEDSPEWNNYINSANPTELEANRKKLPKEILDILPNQGKYTVAQFDKTTQDWKYGADPSRELYCTPYGCYAYQQAGATDVPTVGGNVTFAEKSAKGQLPFEKIDPNKREPGDMALLVENAPDSYIGGTKTIRRPHHTTIYSDADASNPTNTEAGTFYNADNGMRGRFTQSYFNTNQEKDDRIDYYRYVGKTKEKEAAAAKALEDATKARELRDRTRLQMNKLELKDDIPPLPFPEIVRSKDDNLLVSRKKGGETDPPKKSNPKDELAKFSKKPIDTNDLRYVGNQQAVQDNTRIVVPNIQLADKKAPAATAEIQRVNKEMKARGVNSPAEVYAQEKAEAQQAAAIEAATNDKLYADNQSAFDKAMYQAYNIVSNPMDALGHYNKYGYVQQGNIGNYGLKDTASPMGSAVNAANPFAWLNAGIRLGNDLEKPETYTTWSGAGNAAMNALEMLPMFTELRPLAGGMMLADDAARAGKYLTEGPLKNAYNLNPKALKADDVDFLWRWQADNVPQSLTQANAVPSQYTGRWFLKGSPEAPLDYLKIRPGSGTLKGVAMPKGTSTLPEEAAKFTGTEQLKEVERIVPDELLSKTTDFRIENNPWLLNKADNPNFEDDFVNLANTFNKAKVKPHWWRGYRDGGDISVPDLRRVKIKSLPRSWKSQ